MDDINDSINHIEAHLQVIFRELNCMHQEIENCQALYGFSGKLNGTANELIATSFFILQELYKRKDNKDDNPTYVN